jgi:hypothetical protein
MAVTSSRRNCQAHSSVIFQAKMTGDQKRRKEEFLTEWRAKSQRNTKAHRNSGDDFEDIVANRRLEDTYGMVPTLQPFLGSDEPTEGRVRA